MRPGSVSRATTCVVRLMVIPVLSATPRTGLVQRFLKVFPKIIRLIRRYFLLLFSSFVLSGCAGTVEMARDLARDLSDIDVAGIAELMGWEAVKMSPEQTAQLAMVPGNRPVWKNIIDESQASAFSL